MIATRPVLALAGGALSLLALAACSSGGSGDTSSSAAASPTASSAAGGSGTAGGGAGADFAAYRDCLAQNGVTLPDFGGNGGGGVPPSGMPTGAPPSGMTPPSGMPSGGPNGGGMQLPDGVDQATWDAAQQACASVAPQG
jgi:hypothetical protein